MDQKLYNRSIERIQELEAICADQALQIAELKQELIKFLRG